MGKLIQKMNITAIVIGMLLVTPSVSSVFATQQFTIEKNPVIASDKNQLTYTDDTFQQNINHDSPRPRQILEEQTSFNNNILEYTFEFPVPTPEKNETQGMYFSMKNLTVIAETGKPLLVQKTVTLLLPQGTKVDSLEIIPGIHDVIPPVFFTGYDLAVGQRVVPLNYQGAVEPVSLDQQLYNAHYPNSLSQTVSTQYKNGYTFYILNLYPLIYSFDSVGDLVEVMCYRSMTIRLQLTPCLTPSAVHPGRYTSQDRDLITRLAVDQPNLPALLDTYQLNTPRDHLIMGDRSSIVDPVETYEYVIITNEALNVSTGDYTFQDLLQSKIEKGMTATIVTTEDIIACPEYWWDGTYGDGDSLYNDTQCKIRNFIRDAKANWETQYVLLGGDGDGADLGEESEPAIIPARELFEEQLIASDLYYCCLDGSFDDNGNGVFGERTDGFDNGEVDLYAEVYIGRAPVDSAAEVSNFVRKTLAYENCDEDSYLRNVSMVAEHLGMGGDMEYGDTCKNQIKDGCDLYEYTTVGIPSYYDVSTLYDQPGYDWPNSEVITRINENVHIINHLGHGNNQRLMKLTSPDDLPSLTNTQYFFGYSQACYSGSFDNKLVEQGGDNYMEYDSIVEHLLTEPHGAFAFIANTRYGWGFLGFTYGASQFYDREFFDALFGENIRNLGRANQDSKEDNIGRLEYPNGKMRYCYFEITLFGDPEVSIKTPPQREHDLCVSSVYASEYVYDTDDFSIVALINNIGSNDEENVVVTCYIDDVFITSVTIDLMPVNGIQPAIFTILSGTVNEHGEHEIRIEVTPVDGETYLLNNQKTRTLFLLTSESILVCTLGGLLTLLGQTTYDEINRHWNTYGNTPVYIDYSTFKEAEITYESLVASGADVLLADVHFDNELFPSIGFNEEEIEAIVRYTTEGHQFIAMWWLYSYLSGDKYVPLYELLGLGFSGGDCFGPGNAYSSFEVKEIGHPMFTGIDSPFSLIAGSAGPIDGSWSSNELSNGAFLTVAGGCEAIIQSPENNLYLSPLLEEEEEVYNELLLYNAFTFAGESSPFYAFGRVPYYIEEGTPLNFYGYASGGSSPYTWYWDFGDETYSTEQSPVHIYETEEDVTVTLRVTDQTGLVIEHQYLLSEDDSLPLIADAHGPYNGQVGEPITFHATATGGVPGYTYHWEFGDGFWSNVQNPSHEYDETDMYVVTLTVQDTGGHIAVTTTTASTIPLPLIADANGPYSGYPNADIQFIGSAAGGTGEYNWFWEFGDGNISCEQNPVHTYPHLGLYVVNLTVIDDNQNSASDTTSADIIPGELIVFAQGPTIGYVNEELYFEGSAVSGTGEYNWFWEFGDGNVSYEQNPMHRYNQSNIYLVNLTVMDSGDNTDSDSIVITIYPMQADAHGPFLTYVNEVIHFNGSINCGVEPYQWLWDFDDNGIIDSDEEDPIYFYNTPGSYTINLTVIDEEGKSSSDITTAIIMDVFDEEAIYYYHSVADSGLGIIFSNITWEASIRITPEELSNSENGILTAARFYHYDGGNLIGFVKIYDEDSATTPGLLLTSEPYTSESIGWVQIDLSTPIILNRNTDVWVSIEMIQVMGEYPMGIDSGPVVPQKGDFFGIEGEWQEQDCGNWNIEAIIWQSPELTVDTQGPYTGFINENIQFTGSASGGSPPYVEWFWEFGDGEISSLQNPAHSYMTGGVYLVNLTVTDSQGYTNRSVTTATIRNCSIVCGYVTDVVTGSPMIDELIYLHGWDSQGHYHFYETISDASGYYQMNVEAGTIVLAVYAVGYYNFYSVEYAIGENEVLQVDIALIPIPVENSVVCGYVTDAVTGLPVTAAWISLDWWDDQEHYDFNETISNVYGYYQMNVAAGAIRLTVYAVGYYGFYSVEYAIGENEVLQVDLALIPIPVESSVVHGFVTDIFTGSPVIGASIHLDWWDGQGHSDYNNTVSDGLGFYQMNVAAGTINISIRKDGYFDEIFNNIHISTNEILWRNITLTPYPAESPLVVWVDDNFTVDTPGWRVDHFNKISEGIIVVAPYGTINVASGTYHESVTIFKPLILNGENPSTTIIISDDYFVLSCVVEDFTMQGFTIQTTVVDSDSFGIIVESSNGIIITDNIVEMNHVGIVGIYIGYATNVTVSGNSIRNSTWLGVLLEMASNCNITDNTITQNPVGLLLAYSSNNRIIGNTFSNNDIGIATDLVDYGLPPSPNNLIYHNNFCDNTQSAYDPFTNTWDNGYPDGGNYWDDYTGVDENTQDGIGDTPYNIPGGTNQDRYPFMNHDGWQQQHVDPDYSFVELTAENFNSLVTCPAGDGPVYQYVKVTCKDSSGDPISGILASDFIFTINTISDDSQWYDTLSCTFTPVDDETNENGEIRFNVTGDTSITGNITIQVSVQGVPLNDIDVLACRSFDLNVDGRVDITDFGLFASHWYTPFWPADFNGNGIVDLFDFAMFAGHYQHHR